MISTRRAVMAACVLLPALAGSSFAEEPASGPASRGFNHMRPEDAQALAAEGFHPGVDAAQVMIGQMAESGIGMAQDAALAKRMYEAAAAQGNGTAAYQLALMYQDGRGVARDSTLADRYLGQAAQAGHLGARSLLAQRRLQSSQGVAVTPAQQARLAEARAAYNSGRDAQAFALFLALARENVAEAQYRVAQLYRWGEGTAANAEEAAAWAARAGAAGHPEAAALAAHMAEFHGVPSRTPAEVTRWLYTAGHAYVEQGNLPGARQMAVAIAERNPADAGRAKLLEEIRVAESRTSR